MSKRVLNIIWLALIFVGLATIIFLMVFFKMKYWSFMGSMIVTMAYGFLNIIFMLVKVINKYEIKRLTAAIYATIVFIGVAGYYIITYIGHYNDGIVYYWVSYLGLLIISILVMTILNFKLNPQKLTMMNKKK